MYVYTHIERNRRALIRKNEWKKNGQPADARDARGKHGQSDAPRAAMQ